MCLAKCVSLVGNRRNLYEVLKVSRLSSTEDIRASYLRLAKQFHPDISAGDDHEEFRRVQEAYSTLSNSWKRTLYDQDLQFQSWESFEVETPEARLARRERYKRYARGERNDLPPVGLTTRGSLAGLVLCGSLLTWVCAKAPEWFGGQGELTYHDPVSDDASVPLVCAYYNPITRMWERLANGESPPSLRALLKVYEQQAPQMVARRKREMDISAIEQLTVANVPKTKTVVATVVSQNGTETIVNMRALANSQTSNFP